MNVAQKSKPLKWASKHLSNRIYLLLNLVHQLIIVLFLFSSFLQFFFGQMSSGIFLYYHGRLVLLCPFLAFSLEKQRLTSFRLDRHGQYSQTSHKRTPLGPSRAVRLKEVSAKGMVNKCLPINVFRLLHVKLLLTYKNIIVLKKSHYFESYCWT